MNKIDKNVLTTAMSYQQYVQKIKDLLSEGKTSTSTINNSPNLIHYTEMNLQRMHRLDKTTHLLDETIESVKKINEKQTWLVITEGWCGDASQIIPVIEKMAELNPLIRHLMIFRDEHEDLMTAFLTDESRSIPKLIILDDEGHVFHTWGPRPQALQERVMQEKIKMLAMPKEERKIYFDEVKTEVQKWYNNDKTHEIQREIIGII